MEFLSHSIDPDALTAYQQTFHVTGDSKAFLSLGKLIAAQSPLSDNLEAKIVLCLQPYPVIGVLGNFTSSQKDLLALQFSQLDTALRNFRYIDYQEAAAAAELLAQKLAARLGAEALQSCAFRAIPRGGLIVLGLLAQALHLVKEQLEAPIPEGATVVVVDDCAFTGARFGAMLDSLRPHPVVFATLHAPLALREAIERAEENVLTCLSAEDLPGNKEIDPAKAGGWLSRLDGKRYWAGPAQFLCYPWNEPDRPLWDSTGEKMERGWRLAPPEFCAKNHSLADAPHPPLYLQPQVDGALALSPHAIFYRADDEVLLGSLETGEIVSLSGTSAAFWDALLHNHSPEAALEQLGRDFDVDRDRLAADLEQFTSDLIQRGYLEPR